MIFKMGFRVGFSFPWLIMYRSEVRTMVRDFPEDGEIKVTLTRSSSSWHVQLNVSSPGVTSSSCLLSLQRPSPPPTHLSFLSRRRVFTPLHTRLSQDGVTSQVLHIQPLPVLIYWIATVVCHCVKVTSGAVVHMNEYASWSLHWGGRHTNII